MEQDMMLFAAKPLSTVHVGIIGLGRRGIRALRRLTSLSGVEVCAVSDYVQANVDDALSQLPDGGRGCLAVSGDRAWAEVCDAAGIDLIYICTGWENHAEISLYAMERGKHVAVEVPAAMSVNDCRKIVDTAERTCRHFFMLENCCFDPFALTTMRLADEGRLGDIIHAEGAYIHDISLCEVEPTARHSFRGWMVRAYIEHGGDPYPTHGLGPICLTMNMHRGDRMKSIVSLSATADPAGKSKLNTSIIRTHLGRTIVLSLDVTSPRPYSREMITCGTKGFTRKYPKECIMFAGDTEEEAYRLTDERKQQFRHPVSERWGSEAEKMTGDNEMNYVMDMRLVHCLREGLPMDIDVYDAAEWSAVTELSAISAQKGGVPVEMPDFTHGLWRTAVPHKFFL